MENKICCFECVDDNCNEIAGKNIRHFEIKNINFVSGPFLRFDFKRDLCPRYKSVRSFVQQIKRERRN